MSDNSVLNIDIGQEVVKILVTSLLTAVVLRLANRMTIRTKIRYGTAYLISLVTNALLWGINTAFGYILVSLNLKAVYALLPALLLSIPMNALVYQRMINDEEDAAIGYKSAIVLSSAFVGIVLGLTLLLVGVIVAGGLLMK